MQKVKAIKLFQTVKVSTETAYFTEEDYEITLEGIVFTIKDKKTAAVTCTSMFNACWWRLADGQQTETGEVTRGSKKAGYKAKDQLP